MNCLLEVNYMPDTLAGMRVFTAVVDAGSFAKAAEKLDLSRGMTSRYVAQVEAHLGVRLLNRTTRRLSLTESGADYYQRATQVLALVEEAERAASREAVEPRGTLRVNTSVAFGARHMGAAISDYLRRYPQVKVDLTLNDRVVDLVEEGFDVAVRIARRIDPGLVARRIARARMVACASPAYLRQSGMPKSPADLREHNCLTYAYAGVQNEWHFTRGRREQTVQVAGNLHANNGDILSLAAAEGAGVTVQPTFLAHELLRAKRLVRILEGWEADELGIFAVYPSRRFLPPKVRSFIDFMAERFGDEPSWDRGLG
jgi:DNA-binding transcriptional LysR family regulator